MTTSYIEVRFDEWVSVRVYPHHVEFVDVDGPGAGFTLESARAKLAAALRAVEMMREIHKTAPENIPPSGAGAAQAASGGTVEPVKHSVGGGCSDRCRDGCKLPSSPSSCGHCEPAPVIRDDVDREFCRQCWYTGSECDCEQCHAV